MIGEQFDELESEKSNQKMDKDKVVVEYTANSNWLGKSIEVKYLKI